MNLIHINKVRFLKGSQEENVVEELVLFASNFIKDWKFVDYIFKQHSIP
jgi:hypothetical protein